MNIKRRNFLKIAGGLTASMSFPLLSSLSTSATAAAKPNAKKLVVLLLQGGNDGINTVIPTEPSQYSLYQALRPKIAIPQSSILPFGVDASGVDFGLHPSFASLMPLSDRLALFPATHSGNHSSRSHFLQHDLYDAGLFTPANPTNNDGRGWLGRYLDAKYLSKPEGIVAFDFAAGQFGLLNSKGPASALAITNPANLALGTRTSAQADAIFQDIKDVSKADPTSFAGGYKQSQLDLFGVGGAIPKLEAVNFNRVPDLSQAPIPGIRYPGGIGQHLKWTVDMLLEIPELEIIHIRQGGFDTHSNQTTNNPVSGQHANILKIVSNSLASFYTDLEAVGLENDVAVVVMTEFGREAAGNDNFGTDHGEASSWMVFGGSVMGGVYGSYPGLETANLTDGRYLKPTIDYRDIFSELIGPMHLGAVDPISPFPGYTGAISPLNFMI